MKKKIVIVLMIALLLLNTLALGEEKQKNVLEKNILKALESHQSIEKIHQIKVNFSEDVALVITEEAVKTTQEWDAPFKVVLTILEKIDDTWQVQGSNAHILLRYVNGEITLVKQLERVDVKIENAVENQNLIQITYIDDVGKSLHGENYLEEKVVIAKADNGKWYVVEYSTYDFTELKEDGIRKMMMEFDFEKMEEVNITIEDAPMPYPETLKFPMEFESFHINEAYNELLDFSSPFSNG